MLVRMAKKEEWDEAMSLAWRVFNKYDAPDYSEEGIKSFMNFITDEGLHKMFLAGEYKLFVAESGGKIVAVSSLRMRNHISLLFVAEKYQGLGVGRKMIHHMMDYLNSDEKLNYCTVNAAPYAVDFYHRLGFKDLSEERENEGIRFLPMKLEK